MLCVYLIIVIIIVFAMMIVWCFDVAKMGGSEIEASVLPWYLDSHTLETRTSSDAQDLTFCSRLPQE